MGYHFFQTDLLSRRALAFSGIAAFHMLIAYLLLTALVQSPPRTKETETVGFVLPSDPLQPPPDTIEFTPNDPHGPVLAPPLEPLAPVENPSSMAAIPGDQPRSAGSAAVPASLPVRVVGTNQLPNSADYYPPDMRRLNVQGATNVRVCVDAQGTRLGDPTIEESSGFARLDAGAVNVARHGRYARSLQGDTPVGNCFRFRIAFKIPQ